MTWPRRARRGPAGCETRMASVVPRPVRAALVLLVLGVLAGSCDAPADSPTTDAPPGTPLAIASDPLVSVGVASGDTAQEFGRVVTPFLLPDDRFAVPDGLAQVIRIFDLDGNALQSLGGQGEGPGEFSALARAWPRGDTIEAFDLQTVRVTRFLPDSSVEVVALRPERFGFFPLPGAVSDGWILSGVDNTGPGAGPPDGRDEIGLLHLESDGETQHRVAGTLGIHRYSHDGGSGVHPVSPQGVYRIHQDRLYVGETLTPRIVVYDLDGTVQSEITWEPAEGTDPAAALAVVRDSALARADSDELESVRQTFDAVPTAEAVPVFHDLLVDGEGFIWVRPYELPGHAHYLGGWAGPGAGRSWLIFTPEGERVGTVEVPDELIPVHIGTDAILGLVRDELGVESVHIHAIERR